MEACSPDFARVFQQTKPFSQPRSFKDARCATFDESSHVLHFLSSITDNNLMIIVECVQSGRAPQVLPWHGSMWALGHHPWHQSDPIRLYAVHRHHWRLHCQPQWAQLHLVESPLSAQMPREAYETFGCWLAKDFSHISNYSSFRQKHPGVPDGSDGSDGTSYPLTENYTLPVAQATGRVAYVLLYFVVTFTHHQKDACITLFAGAAVMLKPFTQCLAMLDHSYYLSFNDFQHLCIQFVFSSMYLCIYIATYLHTVYLDWQHAVIVSNWMCAWSWRSSELRDTHGGCDWATLAICPWGRWSY